MAHTIQHLIEEAVEIMNTNQMTDGISMELESIDNQIKELIAEETEHIGFINDTCLTCDELVFLNDNDEPHIMASTDGETVRLYTQCSNPKCNAKYTQMELI